MNRSTALCMIRMFCMLCMLCLLCCAQMHVVYLGVRDPPGAPGALAKLRRLCEAVVAAFAEAGLLLEKDERWVKESFQLACYCMAGPQVRRQAGACGVGCSQHQAVSLCSRGSLA